MGQLDLPVSADPAGDGPRLGHRPAVQVRKRARPVPPPRSGRADGAHELRHAVRNLYAGVLRVRAELLRGTALLSALLRRRRHLGVAVARQPAVAAGVLLRPAGMALAEPDLLATSTLSAGCAGGGVGLKAANLAATSVPAN